MVYESDLYSTRRTYTRPTVTSYSATAQTYHRVIPATAHMRLNPIAYVPPTPTYRPTASLYAELDRVAHRVRPSNASYSDEFLSTPEMTNFDDETREIRAKMNLLMRKIYAPPPRVQKPIYFPIKSEEPYPTPDYANSTILSPMRRVHREIGRRAIVLLPKEIERHPRPAAIGKGRLACVSFAGGHAFPRRRNLAQEADTVKSEVSCLSYYGRMRSAANEDSENRKPYQAEYSRSIPIYSAPLRSKNKSPGDGLTNKGRKLTDPIPVLDEAKPKRQLTRDIEEIKVKRQVSRDQEEIKFKRQSSRDQEEVKVKRQSSHDFDDVKVKRQASRDLSENIFTRQISKEQVQPQPEPEPEPEQVMEVDSTVAETIPDPEEAPVIEPEPEPALIEDDSKAARKKRREEKKKLKEQQQSFEAPDPVADIPVEVPSETVEESPKEEPPAEPLPTEVVPEPIVQQSAEPISEPAPVVPELPSEPEPEPQPEPQPEIQPEPIPESQPIVEAEPIPEADPIPVSAEVPTIDSSTSEPAPQPEPTLQASESIEVALETDAVPAQPEVIPAEPERVASPEPLVEEPQSPEIEIPLEGQSVEDVVLSAHQVSGPLEPVDDFWGNEN